MGSRGKGPGKFLDFTVAKRQENAFLGAGTFSARTDRLPTSKKLTNFQESNPVDNSYTHTG